MHSQKQMQALVKIIVGSTIDVIGVVIVALTIAFMKGQDLLGLGQLPMSKESLFAIGGALIVLGNIILFKGIFVIKAENETASSANETMDDHHKEQPSSLNVVDKR